MRRLKLVMKSKLNGGSKINAVNIWAVALLRYRGVTRWTKNELQNMDRMTRKFNDTTVMRINVALKVNLRSFSLNRNYSYPLTWLSNVGEPSWN